MGRIGGEPVIGFLDRPDGDDPLTTALPGASVEIVRPWQEVRLLADPAVSNIGLDLTFTARTQPYGLRRGTMRAGRRRRVGPVPHAAVRAVRRHVHRRRRDARRSTAGSASATTRGGSATTGGARSGCGSRSSSTTASSASGTGSSRTARASTPTAAGPGPTAAIRSRSSTSRPTSCGPRPTARPAVYGEHGEEIAGLRGTSVFTLEGGRTITVEAEGTFARPYEPFQRGGPEPDAGAHRRRPDRHRDLRGHRRPPPPVLPRHDREWDAAGMSGAEHERGNDARRDRGDAGGAHAPSG